MINVHNLRLDFGERILFSQVELQFVPGNCYGVIGANGAGKSTFLKILSGEIDPTSGKVDMPPKLRMSVLKQNQNEYDAFNVMQTVIMGNARLYEIMQEKEALYAKSDFTDADGIKASELEGEFAEMNGWEAESDAGRLLQGLGIPVGLSEASATGLSPCAARPSSRFACLSPSHVPVPQPRGASSPVWACARSLAATCATTVVFLSSGY